MAQKFRKASFRGVEFYLSEDSSEFGRRSVSHEFPQRDKSSSEDLGRKSQKFSVEGYVLGPNENAARDALIEACETAGPGILIHPYYGQKNVICESCTSRHSSSENRVVRFSLSFVETATSPFPIARADSVSATEIAADELVESSSTDFSSKFSVAGRPAFVAQSAIAKIKAASSKLKSMQGNVSGVTNTVADFANATRSLETSSIDLVNNPSELAGQLAGSVSLLRQTLSTGSRLGSVGQRALSSLFKFGSTDKPIPVTTSTRKQEETNRVALNDFIKQVAVANAAKDAASAIFSSAEEAVEARDSLFDAIDELELTATDKVYESLRALRVQISQAVAVTGTDLRRVHRIETQALTTSIVLVYSLFGNLDREEDLIARNSIPHPGFIVGGTELEVLSG